MGELLPHLSILTGRTKPAGGLFLLHFSWGRPRRVLPVIPALRSPDFPHGRPFGLAARLSSLLAILILLHFSVIVKWIRMGYNSNYINLWNWPGSEDCDLGGAVVNGLNTEGIF